jgi:hypothetical protein
MGRFIEFLGIELSSKRAFQCLQRSAFLAALISPGLLIGAVSISFNQDIRPILSENCFLCHGPDDESRSAGLRLDQPEGAIAVRDGIAAIVKGDPENSELVRRIETEDPDDQMPPPDSERYLSTEQKVLLRAWIAAGAPYERHWAFEPISKPEVPMTPDYTQSRNPIDHFIQRKLAEENLEFSPEASPEKLIRRLTFDLTGLPPTLEEIDEVLNDSQAGQFDRLVDRLLQRESYGERMASEWLDVARYSDTYGYQVDRDRFVWPWRDWVIGAFNRNLPYDDFIEWQLAGDLMPGASREQILATTFNRLHPQKVEGGSVPEEFRIEYVADRTQTFSTAFMGLTFECARCHDHKYDPLKQKEYYQLTSFFANIDEAGLYSYFTDSVPTPTLVIGPKDKEEELLKRRSELAASEKAFESVVEDASTGFETWVSKSDDDEQTAIKGVALFDFDSFEEGKIPNLLNQEVPGTSGAANRLVAGKTGLGLELSGDDQVELKVGNFPRYQPFSISLWLQVPELFERTVVFHRSRAWTDAGSRGYQLLLEDGKPSFSLIHFWPGNAIRVKAEKALPLKQFVHLTISYDGSSTAAGVRIYVDGKKSNLEIVQDQLTKNITGGGQDTIAIGARFRDVGFKKGVVDDFHVYDVELSEIECKALYEDGNLDGVLVKGGSELSSDNKHLLKEHYLFRHRPDVLKGRGQLLDARKAVASLENGMQEIMVMKEQPRPRTSFVLNRGAYDARGEKVARETPSALPKFDEGLARNRLGLAEWLTSDEHPLTARVVVNRYWQMIFGQGLVRTPEDFGSQGQPPTHPELLDWLAADFMENGWDVKRLLKLMVSSNTYRQSSRISTELLALDPENRWLARGARYRLPAEMIRDNALQTSGLLVSRIGGAPAKPYEVAVSFKPTKIDDGDGLYRRSLYTYWKRTGPAPVMMALDASKRDVCSVKRETTATPLQAFVFMNDPQFVEAARQLALQVSGLYDETDSDGRLRHLFRILTSRKVRPSELAVLRQLLNDQRAYFEEDSARSKAFLGVGASELDDDEVTPELAALAVVASGLFSHDECIMKR